MDTKLVDAIGQAVVQDDKVVEISGDGRDGFFFMPYVVVLVERRGVVLGGRSNLHTVAVDAFKKRFIKIPRRDNGTTEASDRQS